MNVCRWLRWCLNTSWLTFWLQVASTTCAGAQPNDYLGSNSGFNYMCRCSTKWLRVYAAARGPTGVTYEIESSICSAHLWEHNSSRRSTQLCTGLNDVKYLSPLPMVLLQACIPQLTLRNSCVKGSLTGTRLRCAASVVRFLVTWALVVGFSLVNSLIGYLSAPPKVLHFRQ